MVLFTVLMYMNFTACSSDDDPAKITYRLEANIENLNSKSRVGFENTTSNFFWTENDQIGITTTASSTTFQKMTLCSGAGEAKGVFEGTISGNPNGYAIYPFISENNHSITDNGILTFNFPETYTYTSLNEEQGLKNGNTFNTPMWSKIGEDLSFKHLGGVICVHVNGLPIGNDLKFTLTTSNKITGTFTADLTATNPTLETVTSNTENSVNITFSNTNDDEIGVFYIPVPTGTYANITAQITKGNDLIASKEWKDQTVGLGSSKDETITHTTTMKKLKSITDEDNSILEFDYNDKGELIKDNAWSSYSTNNYTWTANDIIMTGDYGDFIYTLEGALIKQSQIDGSTYFHEYNTLNKLIKYGDDVEINWENGKITSYTRSGDGWSETYTLTYEDDVTTGWCPLYDCELWDELEYFHWANPQLCGMLNHYLPIKIEGAGDICYYSYELDNNGYVSRVQVERASSSNPNQIEWTKTYTYTWQ